MLKAGESELRPLFLGEEEIRKAFLGETLVYEAAKPSRLPEGYTEIEYIQSGSGQYINTGILASGAYKIEMSVEPLVAGSGNFWGANMYTGGRNYELSSKKNGNTSVYLTIPSSSTPRVFSISGNTMNQRIYLVYDRPRKAFRLDDAEIEFSGSFFTVSYHLYLLFGNKGTSSASSFTALNAKLYSCNIYNSSGEQTREFVPCRNPYGVPGLYDLVNGKFYTGIGGTFTAGPAV